MVLSIISLRSAGLLNSAPASRGECVGPPLGAAVLAAVDTEDVAWFETALVIDPIPDGAPAWSTAGFRECHDIRYEIGWEPGRRELKSARLWFDDPDDGEVLIEIEKVFTFRMRGIGYWHPQWGHGSIHGPLETGRESIRLEDFDPTDFASIHLQNLVIATMGDRRGVGVVEQIAIGPHQPSGLTGLLDGHRIGNRS